MTGTQGRPGVFLDRDGILNELVLREGAYVSPRRPEDFRIRPGVAEAVARLRGLRLPLLVVTNQPDVGRGLMPRDALQQMSDLLRAALPIDDLAVCVHDDADGCECRKPKPGLLRELAARWGVDLGQSFMVGDSWRDVGAGRAVGCRTILIASADGDRAQADTVVHNLDQAVADIDEALLLRGWQAI